jgi:hypothetical protein
VRRPGKFAVILKNARGPNYWLHVLNELEEYQEEQRLLTRLIKWLEQAGRQDQASWPADRLKLTLANAHCLLGDCWLVMKRPSAAFGAI